MMRTKVDMIYNESLANHELTTDICKLKEFFLDFLLQVVQPETEIIDKD